MREESGKRVRDECTQGEQGEGRRVSLGDMGERRGNWQGTVKGEITPGEQGEGREDSGRTGRGRRGLQTKELVRDKRTLGEQIEGRGDCEVRGESIGEIMKYEGTPGKNDKARANSK